MSDGPSFRPAKPWGWVIWAVQTFLRFDLARRNQVAVHRCSDTLLMRGLRVRVHPPSSNHRLRPSRSPRSIHPSQDGPPSPSWMSSPAYGLQDVPVPPDLAPGHSAGLRAPSTAW